MAEYDEETAAKSVTTRTPVENPERDESSEDSSSKFLLPEAPEHPIELARLSATLRKSLFDRDVVPPRIGRYEIRKRIGGGGIGYVYEAWDERLARRVALKVLRPEMLGHDGIARVSLDGEAQALAQLSHPNVVSVYDLGRFESQVFIAMQLVEGATLREWNSSFAPRMREIVEAFIEIADGLAAAHACGLVHGDFKPENVLMDLHGHPKILDFGLARRVTASRALAGPPRLSEHVDIHETSFAIDGEIVGTPSYMAPEQHLGEAVDGRADQFAFGVALYEMLVGCRPFAGDNLRSVSLAIVAGRWSRPEGRDALPKPIAKVILRTLRVNREQRFPDMHAVANALREALGVDQPSVLPQLAPLRSEGEAGALMPVRVPPAGNYLGYQSSISRSLVLHTDAPPERIEAMAEELVGMLNRVVPRRWAARAKLVRSAGGLSWSNRHIELSIDPASKGLVIVATRKLAKKSRFRAVFSMAAGIGVVEIVMAIFAEIVLDVFGEPGAFMGLLALAAGLWGAVKGLGLGRSLHNQGIENEGQELEYVLHRLAQRSELFAGTRAEINGGAKRQALPASTSTSGLVEEPDSAG